MTSDSLKRATYDTSVIDAWQAQRLQRRERERRDTPRYFMIAIALAPLYFVSPVLPLFSIIPALIFYSRYCSMRDASLLKCPHCLKAAAGHKNRASGNDTDGMFCPHCHYWLTSPYAKDSTKERT